MHNTFSIPFTAQLSQISTEVHDDILFLLKRRLPQALCFDEDPEIYQLYLALILIRSKYLQITEIEDGARNQILIQLKNKKTKRKIFYFQDKQFGSLGMNTVNQLWEITKSRPLVYQHLASDSELLKLPEVLQLEDLLLLLRSKHIRVWRDEGAKENAIFMEINKWGF